MDVRTTPVSLDDSVQLALHAVDGRFPTFHRVRLRRVATSVDVMLEAADVEAGPGLRTELLTDLARRLDERSIRSLITIFQARRHGPAGADYARFDAALADPAVRADVLAELPELARLLDVTVSRWLDHVTWVVTTAAADRHRLAQRWGTAGRIASIRLSQGDTHCGGRSVAVITGDEGARLVLKPTVSRVHPALAALLRRLDDDGTVFGPVLPDRLAGDGHEWQRFETPGTFTDASAARYLRRYGALSALLYAIGATDIHRENVIATGQGPVVVDTETLCSLPPAVPEGSAHEVLARSVEAGVLRTMLYPTRFLGSRMPLDLSALGVPSEAADRYEGVTVTDAGTDDIRFASSLVPLGRMQNRLCTAGGEQIDPRLFAVELLGGYSDAMALLRRRQRVLRDVLRRHPELGFRQVFRATWRYTRLLEASTHPSRLLHRDRRLATLRLLAPTAQGVPERVRVAVRDAEVEALLDGDIPYFEVTTTGDLHANGSAVPLARLDRTPAEMMVDWWERVLAEPLEDHLRHVRLALDAAADDAWRGGAGTGLFEDLAAPASAPRVTRSQDGRSATWLSSVQVNNGLYLAPVTTSLYEGGGTLCALWETRRPGEAATTRELLRSVMAGATFHEVPVGTADVHEIVYSPFTGALSDAVVTAELALRGVVAPDPARAQFLRVARRLPDLLDRLGRPFSGELLNGLGGTLTAMNRFRDQWSAAVALDAPRWTAWLVDLEDAVAGAVDRLGSLLDAPEAGVAHGNLGRLLGVCEAVDLLAGLTGRRQEARQARVATQLRAVLAALPDEDAFRDPRTRQSWCRGAAGTAPALVRIRALVTGDPASHAPTDRDLELLVEALLAEPPSGMRDLSLCHGAAGQVLALVTLGRSLRRPALVEAARTRRETLLAAVREDGWTSGLGRSPGAEGFFVGRSGWDLAQAALLDPRVRVPRMIGGWT